MRSLVPALIGSAILAALSLSGHAHASSRTRDAYGLNLDAVKMVECYSDEGAGSGTGSVIGRGRVLTAHHVIAHTGSTCTVEGHRSRVIFDDPENDIAVLEANLPADTPILQIGCQGYAKGELYLGIGYGLGEDFGIEPMSFTGSWTTLVPVETAPGRFRIGQRSTDKASLAGKHAFATLEGDSTPGMSGGPIFSMKTRQIIGMVNNGGHGVSGSRELSDTALCSAMKAPPEPLAADEPPASFKDLLDALKGPSK